MILDLCSVASVQGLRFLVGNHKRLSLYLSFLIF